MKRNQLKQYFQRSEEDYTPSLETVSLEEDQMEISGAEAEMADAEEVVDELEDAADGLESISEALSASLENGGLDPQSSHFMAMATASYTNRLGLDSTLPSLESFGGESDREEATKVSLEAVSDYIKKIWEAIKSAIQKAIKAMTDLFAKVFGGAAKLEKAAQSLAKAANDAKGSAQEDKISISNISQLHIKGKYEAGDILDGLKNTQEVLDYLYGDYADDAAKWYQEIGKALADSSVKASDDADEVDKDMAKFSEDFLKALADMGKKFGSTELPGGKSVAIEVKSDDNGLSAVDAPSISSNGGEAPNSGEIDTPSLADVKKMAEGVESIAKTIQSKKKAVESLDKAREDALKAADKFVQDGDGGKLGKAWDKAKITLTLRSLNKGLARPVAQVSSMGFSTGRAVLMVGKKAVEAYGEEKKD